MLKRLTVAVAALFVLSAQAFAAGTIPYSLSQQLDEFGKPLAGCKLYLIQAGTVSTPQNGYQDTGLTLVLPNPLTCDASGRLPQFFLADGSIKVRLTKSTGVNVVTADGILVVGASSGGGGGSPVDPTTVIATGDVKVRYGTGVLSGFVRMNGRTVGSASSGATERANADVQALFEYLWNNDPNLTVSTGRGGSSAADWAANKLLTLPDMRGRGLQALDDMGNSAAGRLTSVTCATPITLGAGCGTEYKVISQAQLPPLTWPTTLAVNAGTLGISSSLGISNTMGISDTRTWGLQSTYYGIFNGANLDMSSTAGSASSIRPATVSVTGGAIGLTGSVSITGGTAITGGPALTGSVTSGGSSAALSSLAPMMLFTTYIKL